MSIYDTDTDAEHKAKVEAYFAKVFAPWTEEDEAQMQRLEDQMQRRHDEQTGADLLADVLILNPSYDPAKRPRIKLESKQFLGV